MGLLRRNSLEADYTCYAPPLFLIRSRRAPRMKLDYLYPVWFILCISLGALLGNATGYGAFRGSVDGMFVAISPLLLLMVGLALMSLWRPLLPRCRCGKCPNRRTRYRRPADDDNIGARFQCPLCGRVYAASPGRFDDVAADGQIVPYLHHSKWGRWKRVQE